MKTNQYFRFFRPVFIVLFFALALGACKKESDVTPKTRIVFWTKRLDVTTVKPACYVDSKLVGTLTTATATAPLCGASGSVSVDVTPGTHTIEIRLIDGNSIKGNVDAPEGECRTLEVTN